MAAILDLHIKKTRCGEIRSGVSWEEYEQILKQYEDNSSPRIAYDNGVLEIFMPTFKHENPNRTLAQLIEIIAEELEIDIIRSGSTTLKRQDLSRGVEPDSEYYIQSASALAGKETIDLAETPPPDLIIEADKTSSSIPRFPIFAALGLPEVWRYDAKNDRAIFYQLKTGKYVEIENSIALPILTSDAATNFLRESREIKSSLWAKQVREWTRSQKIKAEDEGRKIGMKL